MPASLGEAFRAGANYIGGRSEEDINRALAVFRTPAQASALDFFEAGAVWAQSTS